MLSVPITVVQPVKTDFWSGVNFFHFLNIKWSFNSTSLMRLSNRSCGEGGWKCYREKLMALETSKWVILSSAPPLNLRCISAHRWLNFAIHYRALESTIIKTTASAASSTMLGDDQKWDTFFWLEGIHLSNFPVSSWLISISKITKYQML